MSTSFILIAAGLCVVCAFVYVVLRLRPRGMSDYPHEIGDGEIQWRGPAWSDEA